MTSGPAPMIGIVVVHFGRAARTEACLDGLARQTWPASRRRIVVVDNGDDPGFASRLSSSHPAVLVIRSSSNVGFPAACNRAIKALGVVDHVALLNNDALPAPGWLEPLVAQMQRPRTGAVAPKVLLAGRYASFELRVDPLPSPRGDWRELGVQLSGARLGRRDVTASTRLVSGFWGWELDPVTIGGRFAWTRAVAVAHVPVATEDAGELLSVRLSSPAGAVSVAVATDDGVAEVQVGPAPAWFDVHPVTTPMDVVNNAGTYLLADGSSRDRGFLEIDRGQYDGASRVFGWSGTAVLLAKEMLDDVGPFDDRLFLYYEDTDLSLRGRLRGWTFQYEPASVVRHTHAGSVGEGSAISRHLTSRNRALVLAKLAPRRIALRAITGQGRVVGAAIVHDMLGPVQRWKRPTTRHVRDELRILLAILERLPGSLRRRRAVLRSATVTPDRLWRETALEAQRPPSRPTGTSQVRGRTWGK